MNKTRRRDLIVALYALERRYGVSGDLYKVIDVAPDIELGTDNISVTKYHFPKVVTFDVTIAQKFEYALGYLRANSNFTHGGIYNPNDRAIILRNIYNLSSIEMKDYVFYDGKPWSMQEVINLDFQLGWILKIRHTPGTKFYQQHDRAVWSRVTPIQTISETLNG
jgi:hypothetical protein